MSEFEQNIKETISIILGTKPGERQVLASFGCGIHEMMFAPATRATSHAISRLVQDALARWEPRIEVTGVSAWPEQGGRIRVQVEYTIRSTLSEEELFLLLTSAG